MTERRTVEDKSNDFYIYGWTLINKLETKNTSKGLLNKTLYLETEIETETKTETNKGHRQPPVHESKPVSSN